MAKLTLDQAGEIAEAIAIRVDRGEGVVMAAMTVLLNAGDRYAPAACVGGEWSGLKRDLPRVDGIPKCPNGHVLTQGDGPSLGFIDGEG